MLQFEIVCPVMGRFGATASWVKSAKAWLRKCSWNLLEWPLDSLDLYPNESLGWDFKKAVATQKPICGLQYVCT